MKNQFLPSHILLAANFVTLLLLPAYLGAQNQTPRPQLRETKTKTEFRLASDIQWKALNPARGAASPQAGTVWGDQTKDGESGFLVKFVDGFSSPPHIHNITYRGVVIAGGLHNDDPKAEPLWMKPGSYWTQPAGEAHITSARGASVAYVEIQSGPYLVKPVAEAFDNGEKPVNVDSTNIVWLNASHSAWIKGGVDANSANSAQMTFLWGRPEANEINGTMVKLPAGFAGKIQNHGTTFKAIVVTGSVKLHLTGEKANLTAGSYFGSEGSANHKLSCEQECVIYIRNRGKYDVSPL